MAKNKLKKYREVAAFSNVIYLTQDTDREKLDNMLGGKDEIVLELGCGKGDYTLNLARKYPDKFFIGVDIKGARLWSGAKKAIDENIENVLFLRMRIETINLFFPRERVSEIWITFPDPFIKRPWKNEDKRLTSTKFFELYKGILKKNSVIHLKTDDETLYNFTLETVKKASGTLHSATDDLYSGSFPDEITSIKTTYEKKYLEENRKIKYIRFSLL